MSRWPMVIIDHIFLPGHSGWSSTHLTPWQSSETCLPRERWISLTFPVKCNPFVDQELAEQSEILETVGDQDPSQFYYGQVTFISTVTPLCREQLSFMSIHVDVHPRSLYFGQLTQPIDINVQGADGEAWLGQDVRSCDPSLSRWLKPRLLQK